MSIRYVAAVLDRLTELSESETLVLIALADFASDDTRECWPSIATLARRSRATRRGVQKIIRRLEARGLIDIATGGHQYGANTANRYRLRFDHDGERLETTEPQLSPRANAVRPPSPKVIHKGEPGNSKGERGDIQGRTGFAPSVIRSVIEPKERLKTLGKGKSVDNSIRDRLEQLEALRKIRETAA